MYVTKFISRAIFVLPTAPVDLKIYLYDMFVPGNLPLSRFHGELVSLLCYLKKYLEKAKEVATLTPKVSIPMH